MAAGLSCCPPSVCRSCRPRRRSVCRSCPPPPIGLPQLPPLPPIGLPALPPLPPIGLPSFGFPTIGLPSITRLLGLPFLTVSGHPAGSGPMFVRYLKAQAMVLLFGGLVGPIFPAVYFALGPMARPELNWMYWFGLPITADRRARGAGVGQRRAGSRKIPARRVRTAAETLA